MFLSFTHPIGLGQGKRKLGFLPLRQERKNNPQLITHNAQLI